MLASFFRWRKDIYSDQTENPAKWPTVRTSINQEERRRRDKTSAHNYVHWVTTGWHDITPLWHFSIMECKSVTSINRKS